METLHESPASCKRKSRYTPLAHAVRFAILAGITDVAELARELECTQSAIYRAKKQLEDTDRVVTTDRTVTFDRTELTVQSQTDRTVSKTDQSVTRASRTRANTELPSEVVISKIEVKNPPTPKSAERVEIVDGRLVVCDELRKFWIAELDGDEKRFDLALIEIGDSLQPNSRRPIESQLGSRLARIAADKRDRDTRYRSAVKANASARQVTDQRREDPFHIAKLTGPRNIKPAPGSDYIPEAANA